MRREKSDGFMVPKSRRKADAPSDRIGTGTTANEQTGQLDLLDGTAASLKPARAMRVDDEGAGRPRSSPLPMPPPSSAKSENLSAMTMEAVATDVNLRRAFIRVADNDGAPGVDRESVAEVAKHLDDVIASLHRSLLDGTYQPGLVRRVWIPKSGGGERGLGIPNVVDRVVQQAVHQVLSPHFEVTFHDGSHGFRPGRSCHTAIARAREHLLDGAEFVVDLDLEKFFDRVNHDRLMARLAARIDDKGVLKLIRKMLTAGVVMPDGVVVRTTEGTPQGGPLSPLLSNIVLDELDWELDQRGLAFVRYADDCNIYVASERAAHRVMAGVVRFIESRLRLKVNATKSAVAKPEDRHFLGFRLRHSADGDVEVLLSKRSLDRLDEKIRELTPRNWGQGLNACIKRLNRYLVGWIGFFGIVTQAELAKLGSRDAHVRRRLRALQLRQWGRRRHVYRNLLRLGVKRSAAAGVYRDHRSTWKLSHTPVVEKALPNKAFAELGLVSLAASWMVKFQAVMAQAAQLQLPLG
jgi:group II intron reverse transcriptase/maturase